MAAHPPHAEEAGLSVFLKRQHPDTGRTGPVFLEPAVWWEADTLRP